MTLVRVTPGGREGEREGGKEEGGKEGRTALMKSYIFSYNGCPRIQKL